MAPVPKLNDVLKQLEEDYISKTLVNIILRAVREKILKQGLQTFTLGEHLRGIHHTPPEGIMWRLQQDVDRHWSDLEIQVTQDTFPWISVQVRVLPPTPTHFVEVPNEAGPMLVGWRGTTDTSQRGLGWCGFN
jgi:hypothetical protein